MKSTDIVGWIKDHKCYCPNHKPQNLYGETLPLFADDEWDCLLACTKCDDLINVNVIEDDEDEEEDE